MSEHEQTDAHIPSIVKFGAGLFVLILIAMFAMWGMFQLLAAKQQAAGPAASPFHQEREIPPEPRLQANPSADLQTIREAEQSALDSYGWVDRESGIVRIPIDVAIDRLLEKGMPTAGKDGGAK